MMLPRFVLKVDDVYALHRFDQARARGGVLGVLGAGTGVGLGKVRIV